MANLGEYAAANANKRRSSFDGSELGYGDLSGAGNDFWNTFADLKTYFTPGLATGSVAGLQSAADKAAWDAFIAAFTPGIGEAPTDGNQYARQSAGWVQVSSGGIADAPNDGNNYLRSGLAWVVAPAPGIADAPNDAQAWVRQSLAWVVSPAADASRLQKAATPILVGPITHTFVTADIGKITRCDTTAGIVNIVFNDTAAVAAGYQALSFFKRIGPEASGNALTFTAGVTAAGGSVTLGTPSALVLTSGSTSVPIPRASRVAQSVTILAGANVAVGIAYYVNAATSGSPADSPGFQWGVHGGAQVHINWNYQATDPAAGRVYAWFAFIALGPLAVDTTYDWQPEWADYQPGGDHNGNVNSLIATFHPAYGVSQSSPIEAAQVLQYLASTGQTISYSNIPSGHLNEKVVYSFARRSNVQIGAADTPVIFAGVDTTPSDIQGQSGSGKIAGNMRYAVAHENGAAGVANTATVSWDAGVSAPSCSVTWAWIPAPTTMGMTVKGTIGNVASVSTTHANHTVPVLYDLEELSVEVQA